MSTEREFQIKPIVGESIMHNTKSLSNLYSLTSSLFGVTAGILGLESYAGFLLYLVLSVVTTLLVYAIRVAPDSLANGRPVFSTDRFFRNAVQFWSGGLASGVSGFVLTWTLFYGLVRV
ncbi:Rab5-interacting protein (Rab5ip) [Geosmithia morbida]|uniref:ER membrane protein complex subunit 6 n=1 Tax=Geosmithia morbida TaxID=1094350 RepID=A0A9P4YX48_9HYPO|nr:Rab5-interacting protein (Rab5ip) [Geosmithia morbida]KAF4123341.1 Rab5-interacting protein (Rab5ip) [Geosmithia morbida]